MTEMMQRYLDERDSFRVWTNKLPRGVSRYFFVRRLKKIGCENQTCYHFSHDPSAFVFELTPIWPVVSVSNRVTQETRETVFYSAKDNQVVLIIEEDIKGRWWDKVFCPTE